MAGSPIVIMFDTAVSQASIDAFDVGVNGALIEAYSGSTFLGSDQAVGAGTGAGNNVTLSVPGSAVTELRLFQENVSVGSQDGIGWDNLTFTEIPVPEPPILALVSIGLAGVGYRRHRKSMP